jgi:hypothetical protein
VVIDLRPGSTGHCTRLTAPITCEFVAFDVAALFALVEADRELAFLPFAGR